MKVVYVTDAAPSAANLLAAEAEAAFLA